MLQFFRDCYQTDRCRTTRAIILKGVGPALALLLVMAVGWALYPHEPQSWARIDELHAIWDIKEGMIRTSVVVEKLQPCTKMIVQMTLNRVKDGTVQFPSIHLNGQLRQKIQRSEVKKRITHWDAARPLAPVNTGLHVLTMKLTCLDPGVPLSKQSTPVTTTDVYVLHPVVRSDRRIQRSRDHAGKVIVK